MEKTSYCFTLGTLLYSNEYLKGEKVLSGDISKNINHSNTFFQTIMEMWTGEAYIQMTWECGRVHGLLKGNRLLLSNNEFLLLSQWNSEQIWITYDCRRDRNLWVNFTSFMICMSVLFLFQTNYLRVPTSLSEGNLLMERRNTCPENCCPLSYSNQSLEIYI